ncbi:MAG: biopolymer transporter ExbD [Flavobacteriales bacterium]|nr:biopolymer transporter ExbD [Flavobacteriales bacterium]
MSKFKKESGREDPAISTASLPDIVFMLLFFFMVTTVMKETDLNVEIEPVSATEIDKVEDRSEVCYIYIGPPSDKDKYGPEPRIQLNDDFADVTEVRPFIERFRADQPEYKWPKLATSLRVDKSTKMGVVSDVKQELRKSQQLKLIYAAVEGSIE